MGANRIAHGHRATVQLIDKAKHDTDPVSVFVNGTTWQDADCAIFVIKGGERAQAVYESLLQQGLITEGKPVNVGEQKGASSHATDHR